MRIAIKDQATRNLLINDFDKSAFRIRSFAFLQTTNIFQPLVRALILCEVLSNLNYYDENLYCSKGHIIPGFIY